MWGRFLCSVTSSITQHFLRKGGCFFSRAITWSKSFFPPYTTDIIDSLRLYKSTIPSWNSSLNKLFVGQLVAATQRPHLKLRNRQHHRENKKVRIMETPSRTKRGRQLFSVRNMRGASGLKQEHEGRKKKRIPAFLMCYHGIKQQQKGPLLPWLNLLRVCAREDRSVL